MSDALTGAILAWLLTYAIHSTVLLLGAVIVTRRFVHGTAARDFVWKLALVGGLVTSTLQVQGGVRPAGSLALTRERPAVASARRVTDGSDDARQTRGTTVAPVEGASNAAPAAAKSPPAARTGNVLEESRGMAWWLVLVWAVIAIALAGRYLVRRVMLAGRLMVRRPITDGPLREMLDALRRAYGHRAEVRLTAASTISSPVALGLDEICVPEVVLTDLDEEQQRGLLAHELAHLVRRDPLWLDAASVVERLFFFQPLNRVLRTELQRNAEYICDDWAAAHHGSGEPLARCLARVAEWIEVAPLGVPVAGMAEQRSLFVTRISRLLEGRTVTLQLSRATKVAAAIIVLAVVVAATPGVHRASPAAPQSAGHSAAVGLAASSASVARLAQNGTGALPPADSAVVQALIDRLKDTDAEVRAAAAKSLGNLHARRAVAALLQLVTDASVDVRAAVAESLGELEDERGVGGLTRLLGDASPDVREQAIDALGQFERLLPVAALVTAAGDERANIRARAAELLGRTSDRSAAVPLARLLKDANKDVRHAAIDALRTLKDASAGAAVRGALDEDDPELRQAAVEYLRELRVAVGDEVILKRMQDPSADVRQAAIEWAKEQPGAAFVPVLRKLLDDDSGDVREAAVDALSEIRGPAANEALRAALNAKDAKVRRAAAAALGDRP